MSSNKKNTDLPDFHDKIKYSTGFKVPQRYFEEFSDKMASKMAHELDRKVKSESIWEKIEKWMDIIQITPRMAVRLASVLLILAIGFNYYSINSTQDNLAMNQEEALDYILAHSDDLEIEDLYTLDIEEIDLNEFTNEESEEYLDVILDDIDDEMLEELMM